jgi:hypothetical protein
MEAGTHDVVVVARENRDAGPALPVPDPDGLVIAGAHHPGILLMELNGADVIQVAQQSE